jgi:hypothetical protein
VRHTGNESHSVLATILGGLEDVGLDASEGWGAKVSSKVRVERVKENQWRTSSGNRATDR